MHTKDIIAQDGSRYYRCEVCGGLTHVAPSADADFAPLHIGSIHGHDSDMVPITFEEFRAASPDFPDD